MKTANTKIAVAQYEIQQLPRWQAFEDKIVRLVEQVKEKRAELLLLGEYAGLELASWAPTQILTEQFAYIQTQLDAYLQLFTVLAKEYRLYIQPGTLPVKANDDKYRNRAYFFSPTGKIEYQDKIHLTPFESTTSLFQAGDQLKTFNTALGKISILTCYDCEFPRVASVLCKEGVQLLLVPSCTEKISGLTRVSICAQARAIENQCYVAQASLVGKASWNDFIDINTGESAVYCPADIGFPENGIMVKAPLNAPIVIYADLDSKKIDYVREHGEMRNFKDMQHELSDFPEFATIVEY